MATYMIDSLETETSDLRAISELATFLDEQGHVLTKSEKKVIASLIAKRLKAYQKSLRKGAK